MEVVILLTVIKKARFRCSGDIGAFKLSYIYSQPCVVSQALEIPVMNSMPYLCFLKARTMRLLTFHFRADQKVVEGNSKTILGKYDWLFDSAIGFWWYFDQWKHAASEQFLGQLSGIWMAQLKLSRTSRRKLSRTSRRNLATPSCYFRTHLVYKKWKREKIFSEKWREGFVSVEVSRE